MPFIELLKSLTRTHAGIDSPFVSTFYAALLQIVGVVHVQVGLQFERIDAVGGILHAAVLGKGTKDIPEIEQVEEQPGVVSGLCLAQMDGLMPTETAVVEPSKAGFIITGGNDGSEEGHCLVTLAQPEAVGKYAHRGNTTGTAHMGQQTEYAERVEQSEK